MRTPFAGTLPSQSSLQLLCACCALWGAPADVLAAPEQTTALVSAAAPAAATSIAPAAATSIESNDAAAADGALLDRPVLTLIAIGSLVAAACVVGMMAGWTGRGPTVPRVRLLNKPKRVHLSVLVPPGPAPRLIPSESPNAKRARPARAPVPRQTPEGTTRSGIVDYLAPFADPAKTIDERQVDYLLESGDIPEESPDPPDESDSSLRNTG